ncbi:unnamed protein product [Paramecium primaurelia]|uniref:Uncharacterized protein n=1 Tax=Paramecium primaurelia TaxID=5886 RepID=A0A8S1LJP8_PARPR|nr:unnamed protein product [Paramecium primaurelia]
MIIYYQYLKNSPFLIEFNSHLQKDKFFYLFQIPLGIYKLDYLIIVIHRQQKHQILFEYQLNLFYSSFSIKENKKFNIEKYKYINHFQINFPSLRKSKINYIFNYYSLEEIKKILNQYQQGSINYILIILLNYLDIWNSRYIPYIDTMFMEHLQ